MTDVVTIDAMTTAHGDAAANVATIGRRRIKAVAGGNRRRRRVEVGERGSEPRRRAGPSHGRLSVVASDFRRIVGF